MNFVLVNGRIPCRNSACALCGESISNSYLRELGTQLYYCDHECYADHCNRVMDLSGYTRAAKLPLLPIVRKNHPKRSLCSLRETRS
jgi:hypothetical protein